MSKTSGIGGISSNTPQWPNAVRSETNPASNEIINTRSESLFTPGDESDSRFVPRIGIVTGRHLVATEAYSDDKGHTANSQLFAIVDGKNGEERIRTFNGGMSVRGGHDAMHVVIDNTLNALGVHTGNDVTMWNETATDAVAASHHPNAIFRPGDHQYDSVNADHYWDGVLYSDFAHIFRSRIIAAAPPEEQPALRALFEGRTSFSRDKLAQSVYLERLKALYPEYEPTFHAIYRASGLFRNLSELLMMRHPHVWDSARQAAFGSNSDGIVDKGFSGWQENPLGLVGERVGFEEFAKVALNTASASRRNQTPFPLESIRDQLNLKAPISAAELEKIKSSDLMQSFQAGNNESELYVTADEKWNFVYKLFSLIENATIDASSTYELTHAVDKDTYKDVVQDPDIAFLIKEIKKIYDGLADWAKVYGIDPVSGKVSPLP